jgi:hypothetical protein
MGVPGADDVMLGYQSTSYHDGAAMRHLFGLQPAPEFLAWLEDRGIHRDGRLTSSGACSPSGRRRSSTRGSTRRTSGAVIAQAPTLATSRPSGRTFDTQQLRSQLA